MDDDFKIKASSIIILVSVSLLNVYQGISLFIQRVFRLYAVENEGYIWFRQLNVHIIYKFIIFANTMSLIYLFTRINSS